MIIIGNNYDDNDMILVITICDDNNDSMTLCWCYKVSDIQPSSQLWYIYISPSWYLESKLLAYTLKETKKVRVLDYFPQTNMSF